MGNNKGNRVLRRGDPAGQVLYEMDGVEETLALRGIRARGSQAPHRPRSFNVCWVNHENKELSAKPEADLNKELGELYKDNFSLHACRRRPSSSPIRANLAASAATSRGEDCARTEGSKGQMSDAAANCNKTPLIATETGRVVSDKMIKTVTVLVERRVKAPALWRLPSRRSTIRSRRKQHRAKW